MPKMPLIGDHIKVGRCYGMIIGGKLIIAKVIQIYPLDINFAPKLDGMRDRKFPSVTESIVRWAWRDAAGSGKWRESPGWLLPAFAFAAESEVACDGLKFDHS
ncbi:MAG: hypothetical protein ACLQFW_25925 [Xanthobacteraceae bacterium]